MSILGFGISDIIGAKIFFPLVILLGVSLGGNYALYRSVGYYRTLYHIEENNRKVAESKISLFADKAEQAERQCEEVKKYYENLPKKKSLPGDLDPTDIDKFLRGGVLNIQPKPVGEGKRESPR
jgi:hypothetical protein